LLNNRHFAPFFPRIQSLNLSMLYLALTYLSFVLFDFLNYYYNI
jgi:hypothetical protein